MFNKDFYPTPDTVIDMMISLENINGKTVLEPSAGKGNIVNKLNQCGANVLYCEIEPLLCKTISNARFLKSDFLDVQKDEISHVDFIIMNPPFSKGAEHILHAWNVAPDGCVIISLCNHETVSNRYTRLRSELGKAIDSYGIVENIGSMFSESERPTNVEIGLIKLYKPKRNEDEDWSSYFSEDEEHEDQANGLIGYNVVRDCVNRYVGACKLFDSVAENAVMMNQLIGLFGSSDIAFKLSIEDKENSIDSFKIELRKLAWGWILNKMNLGKYMTNSLKEDLNKFVEKQKQIPFTMSNIYRMIDMVIQTNGQRIDRAIVEVFEAFTKHSHENRYMVEGWKTNSHYMINKKIIVPYIGEQGKYNGYPEIAYGSRYYQHLEDFQKCLCVITGKSIEDVPSLHYGFFSGEYKYDENKNRITTREPKEWGVWYDWGFFEIKVFKKGTLHMKFKDDFVWARFNQEYARIKGFVLPSKY